MLLFTTSLFAQTPLQKTIDFEIESVSINEALLQLSEAAETDIAFSGDFFEEGQKVSVSLENASLEEVLQAILKETKVDYKTLRNRIILSRRKPQKITISGYIEDKQAGERLIAATVYCPNQEKGIVTNEYGFYSLTLEATSTIELLYSYLGFKKLTQRVSVVPKEGVSKEVNVALEPSLLLEEIVIEPEEDTAIIVNNNPHKTLSLNAGLVQAVPKLCGTADPIRTAQNLAGVQGGVDGLGGMQVRGGESGQNLMLLDGVPVYIPYHLQGIYSIYNANATKSSTILKSYFPARYGGGLSSVVDVRMRDGNHHEWEGQAEVNLINTGLVLEGPFKKEKGGMLLAARFSPGSYLLDPTFKRTYFQRERGYLQTSFYDLNLKLNYKFSQKDRVYLSFFSSNDDLNYEAPRYRRSSFFEESELSLNWGNNIAALRWNHLFNERLFLNTTFTYSQYGFQYSNLEEFSEMFFGRSDEVYFFDTRSDNKEYGVKMDFDYLPNPNHTFRFGLGSANRAFTPDLTYFDDEEDFWENFEDFEINELSDLIESETYNAVESYAYVEDQIKIKDLADINIGLRATAFNTEWESYYNLEPRMSLQYKLNPKWTLSASGSRMIQYLHLVATSALRLPNDIWIPSSDELLPQEAWQTTIGASVILSEKLSLSIETYYKIMENQYVYPDDPEFLNEIEDKFEPEKYLIRGVGQTYGIETSLQFIGENNGSICSYTIAKNERQFDGQNLGNSYPHNYDQRHQVKWFFYQNLGRNFRLSTNWIFNSPNPRFNILAIESGQGLVNIDANPLGFKNENRSEPYHRLDIDLSYEKQCKRFKHQLQIGLYNLYNRENVAYYEVDFIDEENLDPESIYPVASLPLLPSFSYSLKF